MLYYCQKSKKIFIPVVNISEEGAAKVAPFFIPMSLAEIIGIFQKGDLGQLLITNRIEP
jgi:hypothetical protein